MKKGYIWALVLVAAIIFGIILVIVQCRADDGFTKNVTLEENGVTSQELDFSATGLKPGDTREYTIVIKAKMEGTYFIGLAFDEDKDGGLRNYINVTLSYEDSVVETTLAELFTGKSVDFECAIDKETPARIQVKLTMPLEIGNEAQGATSDFTAMLTAERS